MMRVCLVGRVHLVFGQGHTEYRKYGRGDDDYYRDATFTSASETNNACGNTEGRVSYIKLGLLYSDAYEPLFVCCLKKKKKKGGGGWGGGVERKKKELGTTFVMYSLAPVPLTSTFTQDHCFFSEIMCVGRHQQAWRLTLSMLLDFAVY